MLLLLLFLLVLSNKPLFRDEDSMYGGELIFGGTDEKHYKGDFFYSPINSGMWAISMDHIVLGKAKFCPNGCKALVDPSTSFIIGPKKDIETINEVITSENL